MYTLLFLVLAGVKNKHQLFLLINSYTNMLATYL